MARADRWAVVLAVAVGAIAPAQARSAGAATTGAPVVYAAADPRPAAPRDYGYGHAAPAPATVIDLRPRQAEMPPAPASAAAPLARPDWLETERVGAPYEANGRWYVPTPEPGYAESGLASWYGDEFQGRATAAGEPFDQEALSAAHPTLPIPSLVQVTNLANGREAILRVTDRGPFIEGRILDVSRRAADVLGFEPAGTASVHVRYLGPAPKRVELAGAKRKPLLRAAAPAATAVAGPGPVEIAAAHAQKRGVQKQSTAAAAEPQGLGDGWAEPATGAARGAASGGASATSAMAAGAAAGAATEMAAGDAWEVRAAEPARDLPAASGRSGVTGGAYLVQVGAFSAMPNAQRARQAVRHAGVASIEARLAGGREVYRVRLGPYSLKASAEAARAQVAEAGFADATVALAN